MEKGDNSSATDVTDVTDVTTANQERRTSGVAIMVRVEGSSIVFNRTVSISIVYIDSLSVYIVYL
jgi:hypothetical protein